MVIKSLQFEYPNFTLDIQDLHITPGKLHVCVGANGCGKSTLFHCLSGALHAHSEISSGFDKTLLHNAFATLNDRLTVLDHVEFAAKLHHTPPQALAHLINQYRLTELMRHKPSMLSAGQYSRLRMVKTLLAKPDLVLLDEPTTGLELTSTMLVVDSIEQLLAQGVTVLVSTHHLMELARLSPSIIGLYQGRNIGQIAWQSQFNHYESVLQLMLNIAHGEMSEGELHAHVA